MSDDKIGKDFFDSDENILRALQKIGQHLEDINHILECLNESEHPKTIMDLTALYSLIKYARKECHGHCGSIGQKIEDKRYDQ